ncbi:MAG: heavy-metal-associated domain-containing protein [Euryarchaeota archaeon]|nr:heavy-metal-associated domain-containing protein [Euryarchaeota archaeon]
MGLFGKPKGDELVLKVEGMTCGHCKMHVEKALSGLKGVKSATVDLGKQTATVVYEAGAVTRAQMAKAVEDAGYKAS